MTHVLILALLFAGKGEVIKGWDVGLEGSHLDIFVFALFPDSAFVFIEIHFSLHTLEMRVLINYFTLLYYIRKLNSASHACVISSVFLLFFVSN